MGFWELVVIGVVALLVLGPERLPGAIRSVHKTVRGIKQFGQQMQAELNDELRSHELHQKLKDAEAKNLLNLTEQEKAAIAELKQAAADVNTPLTPVTGSKDNKHEPER
ncbi:Sec-independent protein translocase protein TatB [Rheinheimera muenzenbergensis]|uniref:Sec-independent protein translocase protein TatB n=1 Tax=Rheinheimera muenzenbergensis TaxID=1193628 RepID=A0ABU8C6H2_9GAMM|nr:Sec-independent protein translocase protein TatB [Gammaproteobacteria bacterium]MBU1557084.1 Sec-independent protein translocase protein TatB [Gammaproteobacteria bacterium]MBU2070865.1 Sec-independent protein translocase protein TatB [Gammaproteobacteria bacterium]MBU2185042.1 Sec-independent protein translocase protein TatB [Gammaproteobacteria bacterium]MBU2204071.1 Sec-independent protein translocase protein TatB [Gammaproteobacteria bacterium]